MGVVSNTIRIFLPLPGHAIANGATVKLTAGYCECHHHQCH